MEYRFIDGAIFFPDMGLLCMADLHIGYEAELRTKGVFVPSSEFSMLKRRLGKILADTKPKVVVINGDFKHAFGRISEAEWRHAQEFLDMVLASSKVILVAGNHDPLLGPLARKRNLEVVGSHIEGPVAFYHGDAAPESLPAEVELVVIGHEHPAVGVGDGARVETVKCYLVGEWQDKELIVLPSMFSLTEGTDVLRQRLHSPFLRDISRFHVYVLSEGDAMYFGTIKELRKALKTL